MRTRTETERARRGRATMDVMRITMRASCQHASVVRRSKLNRGCDARQAAEGRDLAVGPT